MVAIRLERWINATSGKFLANKNKNNKDSCCFKINIYDNACHP